MKPIKTNCLDRWIAAMKSGTYKQCHGAMRRGAGEAGYAFCGLGVLVEESQRRSDLAVDVLTDVMEEAGLKNVRDRAETMMLWVVGWNDVEKCSLPVIAERVEAKIAEWRMADRLEEALA